MPAQLIRFELADVSDEEGYDPVVLTLFVNSSGVVLNGIETFGYWGRTNGGELWPLRLVAGGDPSEVAVDFGYNKGDDLELRYGSTNVRNIMIKEDALCHFGYAGDTWTVRIRRVVTAGDGLTFRPTA